MPVPTGLRFSNWPGTAMVLPGWWVGVKAEARPGSAATAAATTTDAA
jgi:hypothetical protein